MCRIFFHSYLDKFTSIKSLCQALIQKYSDDAARAAEEAEKFRASKMQEMQVKLERMKEERRKKEMQGKQRM